MQTLFIRGPSVTFRMVVLVIASIALMTIDHRWHSLEMARSALSGILYPLQYTIDLPIRLFYWADETLSTKQTLLEKNREYQARHLENRVQLQKLDILEKENNRLRQLLSATPKITERLLISEIINVDVDPYRLLIVLNKGSSKGVYQGQPILDALGIMGQVVHAGVLSSTAMLITDASHATPVQIDRTGLRANAFGTGKIDQLNLRHLPHNVDVQVGDTLITSGLGGIFPPNYPVARITKVERPAGDPFAVVEAVPLAQLDKTREVLLVWRNEPLDNTENKAEIEAEQKEANADEMTPGENSDNNATNNATNNEAAREAGNTISEEEKEKTSTTRRGNRE